MGSGVDNSAAVGCFEETELGPELEAIWRNNYSVYAKRKLTKAAQCSDATSTLSANR